MWATQRVVETTIQSYGNIITGTWAANALYRAFGARIGSLCVIRNKTPAIAHPDLLCMGNK